MIGCLIAGAVVVAWLLVGFGAAVAIGRSISIADR